MASLGTIHEINTYPQALAFIEQLNWGVMDLGIERMAMVLETLGNPQDQVKSIHVVGTNGKGSTCATLNSIYKSQGYTVGMFTSPHLVNVRERIQLRGQPVTEADFVTATVQIQQAIHQTFPTGDKGLTYFEFINAMAFWLFAQKQVNIALIEAGLGGRLDSTNTLKRPELVIVTPISLDHTDRLGETLGQIASEKAGVFKPGCSIIMAPQHPEAEEILIQKANLAQSTLIPADSTSLQAGNIIHEKDTYYRELILSPAETRLKTNLLGRYQAVNLAVALQAIETLHLLLPTSQTAIAHGLETVHWPGRFQQVTGQNLIIDGSHNEHGIHSLLGTLAEDFPTLHIHWGITLLANRDPMLLGPLLHYAGTQQITFLKPHEPERFHPPAHLAERLKKAHSESSLEAFLHLPPQPGELRILTGSLYTAGTALRALQSTTA